MRIFGNLFGSKYSSKNLIEAYKSQKRNSRYHFLTLSFLECSKNSVAAKDFFQIFSDAYDSLKNEKILSQEEIWIFLDMGILMELGEIDPVDFMARQIVSLPKLTSMYSIFMQYNEQEREIISSIESSFWNLKVQIFNEQNKLADGDDVYSVSKNLSSSEKELWRKYNNELYQKVP